MAYLEGAGFVRQASFAGQKLHESSLVNASYMPYSSLGESEKGLKGLQH